MATTRIYMKPAGAMWFDLQSDMPLPAQLAMWQSNNGWIVTEAIMMPIDSVLCVLNLGTPPTTGGMPKPLTGVGTVTPFPGSNLGGANGG